MLVPKCGYAKSSSISEDQRMKLHSPCVNDPQVTLLTFLPVAAFPSEIHWTNEKSPNHCPLHHLQGCEVHWCSQQGQHLCAHTASLWVEFYFLSKCAPRVISYTPWSQDKYQFVFLCNTSMHVTLKYHGQTPHHTTNVSLIPFINVFSAPFVFLLILTCPFLISPKRKFTFYQFQKLLEIAKYNLRQIIKHIAVIYLTKTCTSVRNSIGGGDKKKKRRIKLFYNVLLC